MSINYTERSADASIAPSVGGCGDGCDSPVAENFLAFKTEVIPHAGPSWSVDDVEYATLERVARAVGLSTAGGVRSAI